MRLLNYIKEKFTPCNEKPIEGFKIQTTPKQFKLEVYRDKGKRWRWRLRSFANNKIVADSGQAYKNRDDCISEFYNIKEGDVTAEHLDCK